LSRLIYRLVFFDVDSTLVTIEGIDVLAGGNPEIAKLTDAAMNGQVPIDEVYARRLEIIKPSRAAVDALGEQYVASLVAGAEETVRTLRAAGADIHLVTAGLAPAIARLAGHLRIPERAVHSVRLDFTDGGDYADFDRRSFLTQPGGKELVVRNVRARAHGKAAFIGDGISDLETRPAVDLFIGFGGVHTRPVVRDNAGVFIDDSRLTAVLPHLFEQ
jgi:phosphoserine phosphatase